MGTGCDHCIRRQDLDTEWTVNYQVGKRGTGVLSRDMLEQGAGR